MVQTLCVRWGTFFQFFLIISWSSSGRGFVTPFICHFCGWHCLQSTNVKRWVLHLIHICLYLFVCWQYFINGPRSVIRLSLSRCSM